MIARLNSSDTLNTNNSTESQTEHFLSQPGLVISCSIEATWNDELTNSLDDLDLRGNHTGNVPHRLLGM
jgi:hypothetical protein